MSLPVPCEIAWRAISFSTIWTFVNIVSTRLTEIERVRYFALTRVSVRFLATSDFRVMFHHRALNEIGSRCRFRVGLKIDFSSDDSQIFRCVLRRFKNESRIVGMEHPRGTVCRRWRRCCRSRWRNRWRHWWSAKMLHDRRVDGRCVSRRRGRWRHHWWRRRTARSQRQVFGVVGGQGGSSHARPHQRGQMCLLNEEALWIKGQRVIVACRHLLPSGHRKADFGQLAEWIVRDDSIIIWEMRSAVFWCWAFEHIVRKRRSFGQMFWTLGRKFWWRRRGRHRVSSLDWSFFFTLVGTSKLFFFFNDSLFRRCWRFVCGINKKRLCLWTLAYIYQRSWQKQFNRLFSTSQYVLKSLPCLLRYVVS